MARTLLLFSKTAAKKERGSFIKSTSDQVPVLRSKTSVLLIGGYVQVGYLTAHDKNLSVRQRNSRVF